MKRIYLDAAATTPVHPGVAKAMAPWQTKRFGNPSSLHAEGREARQAVDRARETLSEIADRLFGEVVFTSSGTEAANLGIIGVALAHEGPRRKIIFSASEHHAVLSTEPLLRRLGFEVEAVPGDRFARLDPETLRKQIDSDVLLVAAMHANNEIGTYNPIAEIAQICRESGALLLVDAVQTFPEIADIRQDADLVVASAHKIGGPKGAGVLFTRAQIPLHPLVLGGGQEREARAGTENVAGIVGFGEAARIALANPERIQAKRAARDAFLQVLSEGPPFVRTAEAEPTLPGHLHLRFPEIDAQTALIRLDRLGISAGSGAACSSGSLEPSHVMLACGYDEARAAEGLRFTFLETTSIDEATEAAERVRAAIVSIQKARD